MVAMVLVAFLVADTLSAVFVVKAALVVAVGPSHCVKGGPSHCVKGGPSHCVKGGPSHCVKDGMNSPTDLGKVIALRFVEKMSDGSLPGWVGVGMTWLAHTTTAAA